MRFLMCNGYSDREIKVIIDEKMKKNTFIAISVTNEKINLANLMYKRL